MKHIVLILIIFAGLASGQTNSIHQFKVKSIDGSEFDFASLKGKKVLVVNTASECGFTPQFKKLQELYVEYGGDGFEIVGFPCNDFRKQDPGTDKEIYEFCTQNYGVTFPMMSKIKIKGDDPHPVYRWLTSSEQNGTLDSKVTWNFQKFLINEEGQVVDVVSPLGSPKGKKILKWLNE